MTALTPAEQAAVILLCAAMTVLTRSLPFVVFGAGRPVPSYVRWLGRALPPAVFALLVVYCLRDVSFAAGTRSAAELLGVAATAAIHLWKRNMMLSIAAGTACCMALARLLG